MSAKALKWAFDQRDIRSSAKFVLVVMASVTNECALFYGSAEFLSEETNLNRKTVFDVIRVLEKSGLITDIGRSAGKSGRLRTFRLEFAKTTNYSTETGTVKTSENTLIPPPDSGVNHSTGFGTVHSTETGTMNPSAEASGPPVDEPPDSGVNHSTGFGTLNADCSTDHSTGFGTGTVPVSDNHSTGFGTHIKIKTYNNLSTTDKTDVRTPAQDHVEKLAQTPHEIDSKPTSDDTVCSVGDVHEILIAGGVPFSWLHRTDCVTAIRDMAAAGVTQGEMHEAVQRAHAAKAGEPFGVFYVRPIVGEIIARRNGYAKTGRTGYGGNALDDWIDASPRAAQA